jgi:uncharacterized protein YodC (DUF2158 family)
MAKFKKGDCVILNSNPNIIMTIEDDSTAPNYECVWLDNKHDVKRAEFDEGVLTKVNCPSSTSGKPLGIYQG